MKGQVAAEASPAACEGSSPRRMGSLHRLQLETAAIRAKLT